MRLRNKQTRKVYTVRKDIFVSIIDTGKIEVRVMTPDGHVSFFYSSFNEMLNDWEDYKPAEPLIKDEKIRKAVRAWADMQGSEWIVKETDQCCRDSLGYFFNSIKEIFGDLELGEEYTIEELCGEEEE